MSPPPPVCAASSLLPFPSPLFRVFSPKKVSCSCAVCPSMPLHPLVLYRHISPPNCAGSFIGVPLFFLLGQGGRIRSFFRNGGSFRSGTSWPSKCQPPRKFPFLHKSPFGLPSENLVTRFPFFLVNLPRVSSVDYVIFPLLCWTFSPLPLRLAFFRPPKPFSFLPSPRWLSP